MNTDTYQKTSLLLLFIFCFTAAKSQTKLPTATEKAADAICAKLADIDVNSKSTAEVMKIFQAQIVKEFSDNMDDLMTETGITEMNTESGRKIGEEIGKKLLLRCPKFIDFSIKLAKEKKSNPPTIAEEYSETYGTISKVTNSDFVIINVKEADGREYNFYWLRYFKGSEKFESQAVSNTGKKIKVTWSELECYLPKAHGYYKIKEIKSIDFVN